MMYRATLLVLYDVYIGSHTIIVNASKDKSTNRHNILERPIWVTVTDELIMLANDAAELTPPENTS